MKASDYTYSVFFSEEDGAFVATVAEFPLLSCVEDDQLSALAGLVDLVDSALQEDELQEPPIPLHSKRALAIA